MYSHRIRIIGIFFFMTQLSLAGPGQGQDQQVQQGQGAGLNQQELQQLQGQQGGQGMGALPYGQGAMGQPLEAEKGKEFAKEQQESQKEYAEKFTEMQEQTTEQFDKINQSFKETIAGLQASAPKEDGQFIERIMAISLRAATKPDASSATLQSILDLVESNADTGIETQQALVNAQTEGSSQQNSGGQTAVLDRAVIDPNASLAAMEGADNASSQRNFTTNNVRRPTASQKLLRRVSK